ncbi:Adaptin ear-binding coat-associated protein 1 NECAP-1 isoform 1 [Dorcoceras hygrometricum]|uniref:Adaptin ear-binding coat-associated protein 1 NECAP-1 isoform 1 n=1 Tax=Dorcoceras hygrometricum TaxID=472368 RepID=A0A2Z7B0W9_9LAMI|nr:Adaptin ear-binding coat-associated protein 1 NECAP-1 isoform 1 [Dorcoceras hygrometricum]
MEEEKKPEETAEAPSAAEEEAIELVLFQVPECYVYLIPPRKSAASYRADEWNVNKWAWEGTLKVVSKGEECIIRLADKTTGDLYARAFLRDGEPHPVEPVVDSSRYFVLRIEESLGKLGFFFHITLFRCHIVFLAHTGASQLFPGMDPSGRLRHAFIGIGFRERTEAYDFQAALHDHMKYLNKKKTAEEMEQQHQKTSSVDYSLKEGETLVLQLKNKGSGNIKSKLLEQGLNNLFVEDKSNNCETLTSIKLLPPPPPSPLSPVHTAETAPLRLPSKLSLEESSVVKESESEKYSSKESESLEKRSPEDIPDDDFGDFQAAG